jgi:hypothetical protein
MSIFKSGMIFFKTSLLLVISATLTSCVDSKPSAPTGSHKVAVAWPPGYEYVPDCNDLIEKSSTSTDVKGPNVTTSFGVTVGGGEYNRTVTPLGVTDSLQSANLKYRQLCNLLPSYANGDQEAFYKARNDMFELIKGSKDVATTVATQTGQAPPPKLPAVPTAASDAAKTAGVDPSKGVANSSATPTPPSVSKNPPPRNLNAAAKREVRSAARRLKQIARKPSPRKSKAKAGPSNRPG